MGKKRCIWEDEEEEIVIPPLPNPDDTLEKTRPPTAAEIDKACKAAKKKERPKLHTSHRENK